MPEGEVCLRFGEVVVEVVQIHDRSIRSLRLHRIGAGAQLPVDATDT